MKPIIYAYQKQISKLFQANEGQLFKGIAFGWLKEDVYHVFTDVPDIAPTGYLLPCIIKFSEGRNFQNTSQLATEIDRQLLSSNFRERSYLQKTVVMFFYLSENTLKNKCFLVDEQSNAVESTLMYVPEKSDLYLRSKGLLEVDVLEKKKIAIIGLGSFGSFVAVELAKAGLGNFKLFDFDRLELSNVARHTCGINDLGRLKTKAVRDLILTKNPYAQVTTFEVDINENIGQFKSDVSDCDLIICLTDENRSRYNINLVALQLDKKAIFSRAITRAEGGDVYIFRPNENKPCLVCLIGKGLFNFNLDEISNKRQAKAKSQEYMSEEDVTATIQVGLSSDIIPICNMVVKITLFELSKDSLNKIPSLNEDLISDYYIWVNRRENAYKAWLPMEYFANRPSILRWYGVKTSKQEQCGNSCMITNPELLF